MLMTTTISLTNAHDDVVITQQYQWCCQEAGCNRHWRRVKDVNTWKQPLLCQIEFSKSVWYYMYIYIWLCILVLPLDSRVEMPRQCISLTWDDYGDFSERQSFSQHVANISYDLWTKSVANPIKIPYGVWILCVGETNCADIRPRIQ